MDVLTDGTAGTVNIDAHLIHINIYINSIIQLRHYVYRSKGGVTTSIGIKRRNAHQAVYTLFRAQEAISIVAVNLNGSTFYTGLIPG